MVGVGGHQTGEQDGKVIFLGGAPLFFKIERGKGGADCSLENFTVVPMLKQVWQFSLFWS